MKKIFYVPVLLFLLTTFLVPVSADQLKLINASPEDPEFTVTATYDSMISDETKQWDFAYNDKWFCQDAHIYNHKLAQLSFGMALSAFRPLTRGNRNQDIDASEHLQDFFKSCGFEDPRMDDYDKNPSLYTVSSAIAHKEIEDEEGSFTLLAVGVCGGGYKNEWLSNLTIGDQSIHLGFLSAATEMYDRVFGYIASHHLYGQRLKIWVSGYSRAAAISNLLGSLLDDSQIFREEDVFVYTFATPRTTREPKKDRYQNIFNICGKMDPVPQVPFADWGYERYGTTLYLPAQQTDSNYRFIAKKAAAIFHELTGQDYWNNVEWDTKLRVFLNYLLKLCPSPDLYTRCMQGHMISMMESKTVSNITTNLMEMASDSELINDENQSEANALLTFVGYTLYGMATSTDVNTRYQNVDAGLKQNLALEHAHDLYLAWMFSTDDPTELFSDNQNYLRFIIDGDVDVAVIGTEPYYGMVAAMSPHGDRIALFEAENTVYTLNTDAPSIFLEHDSKEFILLLPKDASYQIIIKARSENTVKIQGIQLIVGHTNNNSSQFLESHLLPDQCEIINSRRNEDISKGADFTSVIGDTFDVNKLSNGTDTGFAIDLERTNIFHLSWRHLVMIAYMTPIVILCLLVMFLFWILGKHRLNRRKKRGMMAEEVRYDYLPGFCISVSLAMFLFQELFYWLMPVFGWQRDMMKLVIGVLMILLALTGYRNQKTKLSLYVIIALCFLCLGDLIVSSSFKNGMTASLLGVCTLIVGFYRHEKPEKWQYAAFALINLLNIVLAYLSRYVLREVIWNMAFYSTLQAFMLALSLTKPRRVRLGCISLSLSNFLLFLNEIMNRTLLSHVLSIGTFYLALAFFAHSTRFREYKRRNDEIEMNQY